MGKLEQVKDYINNNRSGKQPVTDIDEQLHLDSMSFIRTVAFLSNDLDIEVEDDEYTADNFGTFRAIGKFIEAKEAKARDRAT